MPLPAPDHHRNDVHADQLGNGLGHGMLGIGRARPGVDVAQIHHGDVPVGHEELVEFIADGVGCVHHPARPRMTGVIEHTEEGDLHALQARETLGGMADHAVPDGIGRPFGTGKPEALAGLEIDADVHTRRDHSVCRTIPR